MKEQIRTIAKKAIPKFLRYHLKNKYRNLKTIKARKVFEQADDQPVWLRKEMLGRLQTKYPYPSQISYDPQSLKKNGEERTKRIIELLGRKADQTKTFLELGCNDGMVCYSLRCREKISIGIDLRSTFDERALRRGCLFIKMDASRLGLRDGSVDFVYSFASFEHFNDPKLVLEEAIRVVKTGGYIYLHYGPLYMSHYGLHAYRSITVPYCQFFSRTSISQFLC